MEATIIEAPTIDAEDVNIENSFTMTGTSTGGGGGGGPTTVIEDFVVAVTALGAPNSGASLLHSTVELKEEQYVF